jgi:hypothetical protein
MAVIEEITRMSPDTTFTQTLDLKATGKVRELVIMGEAASASKVIESLEQSPLFQNASQRSQTTRGSQPNSERYHISTEIKPRPVPAAVLAELEPSPLPATPTAPVSVPIPAADAKSGVPASPVMPAQAPQQNGAPPPAVVPPPANLPVPAGKSTPASTAPTPAQGNAAASVKPSAGTTPLPPPLQGAGQTPTSNPTPKGQP